MPLRSRSPSGATRAALVSPATAYRYFPDQLSLLRAALQDALLHDEEIATPLDDTTTEPAERVARATEAFLPLTLKRESLVRAVMALSLLQSVEAPASHQKVVARRPGYRLAWIAAALAPLEGTIAADELRRLTRARRGNEQRSADRAPRCVRPRRKHGG